MKVLLIVIVVLIVLLLCLLVGIDVRYSGGQLCVGLRIGLKVFWLYPEKFGMGKKRTKPSDEAKIKPSKTSGRNLMQQVSWEEIQSALELLIRSIKQLRFRMNRLKLHFISASADPYHAAMAYGYANAAVNALGLPRMKRADVQIGVDFTENMPMIDGYVSITIRVFYLCKFGFTILVGGLKLLLRHRKRLKREQKANACIAGKEG